MVAGIEERKTNNSVSDNEVAAHDVGGKLHA